MQERHTKLEFFCNNKDKTPFFNNLYIVYYFNCPRYYASYVGKTQQTLHECFNEHAWSDKDSAVRAHINECDNMLKILFFNTSLDSDITTPDHRDININIVKGNVQMIDSHKNWNILLYTEVIKIINKSYFCVCHKNRWKHNEHFKTAVFHNKFTLSQQTKYLHIEN